MKNKKSIDFLYEKIMAILEDLESSKLNVRVKSDQLKLATDKIKDIEEKHRERLIQYKKTLLRKKKALDNAKEKERKQAMKPQE